MRNNKFECIVKYTKVDEKSGKEKKATEVLLIITETFGDAEIRAYKWLEGNTSGDGFVDSIKRSPIASIQKEHNLYSYYYCATMVLLDDSKAVNVKVLFNADSMRDAENNIKDFMDEDRYYDEVLSIAKTKIVEVIDVVKSEEETEEE